jgi:hypothetical protein
MVSTVHVTQKRREVSQATMVSNDARSGAVEINVHAGITAQHSPSLFHGQIAIEVSKREKRLSSNFSGTVPVRYPCQNPGVFAVCSSLT